MKWIKDGDYFGAFVSEVKKRSSPPQQPAVDPMAELERLAKLQDTGVVTDAEFSTKKAEILARV